MRILASLILAAGMVAAGAAVAAPQHDNAQGEAELAKVLAGRVPGKPVDCISEPLTDSSQVIDGTAIVYRDGGTLYVNRPRIGAQSLNNDEVLVTKTFGSQLCSLDTVQLYDRMSHMPMGFVGLGEFVPYTRPKHP